jgi:predicted GH43/DUF377 family glycosyl hydrolase
MLILSQHVLNKAGSIHPIIIPAQETSGLGLMNPSIINDNGKLIVNLRQVNYTFYHSEAKLFQHPYGPLTYIHPENDLYLRTWNWYLELDNDLNITRHTKIDTSQFDTYEPKWDFVGLEDARLMRWDDKLFISGVRRDTTTHGEGRMELSEIKVTNDAVTEVSRFRIPTPKDPKSYCEKNWMPVLDMPYHYVKWTNPTELVKVDPVAKTCETVYNGVDVKIPISQRGGSQVIKIDDKYIALTHEVDLFESETSRKDAVYRHRFVIWDDKWNITKYSKAFSIMGGHVEFAVGMCAWQDRVLITFGFQDNAAYILNTDINTIMDFIDENS